LILDFDNNQQPHQIAEQILNYQTNESTNYRIDDEWENYYNLSKSASNHINIFDEVFISKVKVKNFNFQKLLQTSVTNVVKLSVSNIVQSSRFARVEWLLSKWLTFMIG